ncbi:MAG: hypothetical protein ACLU38_15405 [Dysosmobacter sp.]
MDIKGTIMNMMSHRHRQPRSHGLRRARATSDAAGCGSCCAGLEGAVLRQGRRAASGAGAHPPADRRPGGSSTLFAAGRRRPTRRKEQEITPPVMRELERVIMLRVVDEYWMDHIDAMDRPASRASVCRPMLNTDPVIAYKKESLEMFEEMISAIQEETVRRLYSVRLRKNEEVKRERVAKTTSESVGGDGTVKKQPPAR